jgi:hypothetical protein
MLPVVRRKGRAMSKPTDWIEAQTAKLLATAKRSGYFREVIQDAKHFESQGYVWDVALAMACGYWCS